MAALPWRTSIQLIEQQAGIEAVPVEQVVVATDQDPCFDRNRQLHRFTRPQVTNDISLLAEEIAPVDRQKRQVNPLALEGREQLREEDCIAGVIERHAVAGNQKAHPTSMP